MNAYIEERARHSAHYDAVAARRGVTNFAEHASPTQNTMRPSGALFQKVGWWVLHGVACSKALATWRVSASAHRANVLDEF